jgi:hypothetical protein
MSLTLTGVRLRRVNATRTRVIRRDNGKILGYLDVLPGPKTVGRARQHSYVAWPSPWAFLGTVANDGEPGDKVPRELLVEVPGIHSTHDKAAQALLHVLDERCAPGVGHPPHPAVNTLAPKEIA